jgi:MFS family permease
MAESAARSVPVEERPPSYREVLKFPQIRVLAISRFTAKMAASTLSYGVMVYLADQGASQFEISLAGSASFLAALLFGLQGGTLADTSSKRRILFLCYFVLSILCLVTPTLFGTDTRDLLVLIFVSSALSQVISPGVKSAVAVVSTPAQLATTGALVNIVGSIGSGIGSAFVAPYLIKTSSINTVLYVGALLYAIGAIRIRKLSEAEEQGKESLVSKLREVDWKPKALSLKFNAQWIMSHRPVASMVLVGAMVTALFEGFNSLLPVYVREVLDEDPANSIYIFAPAGIGYLIGALGGPWLIHRWGERRLAVVSLLIMSIGVILLGLINTVAPLFAWMSPMRLLEPFLGINLSQEVLAAGVITIPGNFGSTATGQSVQVYINRHVPVLNQGGVFGLQSVQQNGFNLVSVFLLGVVASFVGPQYIFVVAPFIVGGIVLSMVRYSFRQVTGERVAAGAPVKFLTREADEEAKV